MWALLNHLVSNFLHVFYKITVLIPQGLQTGNSLPREDQPVIASFGVFIFDYYHFIILIHLEKWVEREHLTVKNSAMI